MVNLIAIKCNHAHISALLRVLLAALLAVLLVRRCLCQSWLPGCWSTWRRGGVAVEGEARPLPGMSGWLSVCVFGCSGASPGTKFHPIKTIEYHA